MKNPMMIVVLALLIVIMAGGFMFGYMLLSRSGAGADEIAEPKTFPYDPGEYFVVNAADDARKLLKADIMLAVTDKKFFDSLADKNHVVRDVIIDTLRGKTVEAMTTGVSEIKSDLIENLNAVLNTDQFYRVYFNEFVLQ